MCGCSCSNLITSTRGEKGDTGATGGTYLEERYSEYSETGEDIYNTGAGYTLTMTDATAAGEISYSGVVFVEATDVGQVRIAPLFNGVMDTSKAVYQTYPAAFGGKSYLSIPFSGSKAVNAGQAFKFNVLGTTGINAKLISANISYFYL